MSGSTSELTGLAGDMTPVSHGQGAEREAEVLHLR